MNTLTVFFTTVVLTVSIADSTFFDRPCICRTRSDTVSADTKIK
jgi:hypothetical protein